MVSLISDITVHITPSGLRFMPTNAIFGTFMPYCTALVEYNSKPIAANNHLSWLTRSIRALYFKEAIGKWELLQ